MLSEQEKVRCRFHLGYGNTSTAQTFALGIPAAMQTTFMIEGAMNLILPSALDLVRTLLDRCDCIYCEVFGGLDTATVDVIGSITINRKRLKELGHYYEIAQQDLAQTLLIVPNPYDQRKKWWLGGGINVGVG